MKISAVVITHNEDFRLSSWIKYHEKYKNDIYRHIIVDNGSDISYYNKLKELFSSSSIIRNETNLGSTGAYNAGIKYALSDPDTDAILLIGNDIEIEEKGVVKLYDILFSDKDYSVVAPIMLKKDSETVESFGININQNNLKFEHQFEGLRIEDIKEPFVSSDSIPGAMNMSKRDFFGTVGLLDEKLFMYAEELDLGIRAGLMNKKIIVTRNVKAWHQHVNKDNAEYRSPLAGFLMGRNEIIIARKYYGNAVTLKTIIYRFYIALKALAGTVIKMKSNSHKKFYVNFLLGVIAGTLNISTIPGIKKS